MLSKKEKIADLEQAVELLKTERDALVGKVKDLQASLDMAAKLVAMRETLDQVAKLRVTVERYLQQIDELYCRVETLEEQRAEDRRTFSSQQVAETFGKSAERYNRLQEEGNGDD